jgi:hypothetical protein
MSTLDSLLTGIKEAMVLAERTAKLGEEVKDITKQVTAMDRRLTRVEVTLDLAQQGRLLPPQSR